MPGRVGGRLEAWNIPGAVQASHLIRGEAFSGRSLPDDVQVNNLKMLASCR